MDEEPVAEIPGSSLSHCSLPVSSEGVALSQNTFPGVAVAGIVYLASQVPLKNKRSPILFFALLSKQRPLLQCNYANVPPCLQIVYPLILL